MSVTEKMQKNTQKCLKNENFFTLIFNYLQAIFSKMPIFVKK